LSREYLLHQLGDYFHSVPPPSIVPCDYTKWRCRDTGIEFFDPDLPGDAAFYDWISRFPSYYPAYRWEYGRVAELLKDSLPVPADLRILDIGCGKGDFLRGLDFIRPECRFGLDLNESAIDCCMRSGIPGFHGTIEEAIAKGAIAPNSFSIATSFHCLEHVADPVDFVRQLLETVSPGGRLFLSTPYSPMSFESDWFDVMNHPPHHMTRWNLAAYRELARLTGTSLRHFSPRINTLRQTIQSVRLKTFGNDHGVPRPALLKVLIAQMPSFLAEWKRLRLRARNHGNCGGDVILVELTRPC